MWTPAGELRIDRHDVRLVRHRFADPLGDGTSKGLWAGVASAVPDAERAINDRRRIACKLDERADTTP